MRELVILSGKGGTGKTSVAASLAALAGPVVMADCDVDAPNLGLLLRPEQSDAHEFRAGWLAVVDERRCAGCGRCAKLCRFAAISRQEGRIAYAVDPLACQGCGLCERVCGRHAIELVEPIRGHWRRSPTRFGPLYHAEMEPGAENSGKLVALLRRLAREEACSSAAWLITDGPPGIGCAVIAAITGADTVLFVVEPTPSGLHDLQRVAQLVAGFGVRAAVAVNKWDLNPATTETIEGVARTQGMGLVGRIPYHNAFYRALGAGLAVSEMEGTPASDALAEVWARLQTL